MFHDYPDSQNLLHLFRFRCTNVRQPLISLHKAKILVLLIRKPIRLLMSPLFILAIIIHAHSLVPFKSAASLRHNRPPQIVLMSMAFHAPLTPAIALPTSMKKTDNLQCQFSLQKSS